MPEGRTRPDLPTSSDVLRTGLHPALRRAGIRQVRFHDLRHSFREQSARSHAIPKERHGAGDALARLMAQSGNKVETSGSETMSAA
jgi:integrase